MQERQLASIYVEKDKEGWRLDHFLVARFSDFSRSSLSKFIAQGHITVNSSAAKAGLRLRSGDVVSLSLPPPDPSELAVEKVSFDILFEDEHLLLINKPPGLVVHPGCGHKSGTLAHGLLYHLQDLPGADAGRPGIVHRLDKDTSGILIVAKTEVVLRGLMAEFQQRKIEKVYHAILLRTPELHEGRIVAPLGRHPVARQKMAIQQHGKYAATQWAVQEQYANGWCLAEVRIETGRTHQIRVHLSSIGFPVAGDVLYGGTVTSSTAINVKRQMLHASTLQFTHPASGEELRFTAPLWHDMKDVLTALRGLSL